jgi:hypothetical protein
MEGESFAPASVPSGKGGLSGPKTGEAESRGGLLEIVTRGMGAFCFSHRSLTARSFFFTVPPQSWCGG